MSDKPPRQHMAKKNAKNLKEQRADKKGKTQAAASNDQVSRRQVNNPRSRLE